VTYQVFSRLELFAAAQTPEKLKAIAKIQLNVEGFFLV
jgi:hypothetical protein